MGLVTHVQPSIPDDGPSRLTGPSCRRLCLEWARFQNGSELHQLGFVLVGVMLAEQQFAARWQLCPYASRGPAAIAAVSLGQFRAQERCGHGTSIGHSRMSTVSDAFGSGLVPRWFTGVSCLTVTSSCSRGRLAVCKPCRLCWSTFAVPTSGSRRRRAVSFGPTRWLRAASCICPRPSRCTCRRTGSTPAAQTSCCSASTPHGCPPRSVGNPAFQRIPTRWCSHICTDHYLCKL